MRKRSTPDQARSAPDHAASARGRPPRKTPARPRDTGAPAEPDALARAAQALRDLKHTEQVLHATQERLERVLASSPTVIYALAVEGETTELVWVSRNIETLLGHTPEDAHAPGWWSTHVHPDDRAVAEDGLRRLFAEGQLTQEYRFRQRSGLYLWIRDDARLRRDPEGRAVEVFGSWADITERRRAEEVLERARAELELRVSERTAELRAANERLQVELAERQRAERASRDSEERLRIVAQTTNDAIWDWNPETGSVWWNQGMETLFGYGPEAVGESYDWWLAHVHPEDRQRTHEGLEEILAGTETLWSAEYRFRRADGSYAFVLDRGQIIRGADGKPARGIGSIIDITERKRAEEALHQANQKLTAWVADLEQRNREMSLLGEMGELLQTCTTADEAYDVVAHQAQQLFHGESGALYVFRSSRDLVEAVATWGPSPPEEHGFAPEECWALRRGRIHFVEGPSAGLQCRHVAPSPLGSYLCLPMMAQGEALGVLHILSQMGRLHEGRRQFAQTVADSLGLGLANLRLREQLRSQAIRDPLTGLFNRRFMEEALEREVRRAARRVVPLSVVMLDIDHFKNLNDTLGHEAGDALLRELGTFLQTRVRSGDIPCRYGGEEIILILPDAPLDDARQRAEELRASIRGLQIQDRGRTIGPVTVSLGVAAFPDHGSDAEALLRAADGALYRAKGAGRDRVMVAGEA